MEKKPRYMTPTFHLGLKNFVFGFWELLRFGYTRGSKMSASIYRNTKWLQKVRILAPGRQYGGCQFGENFFFSNLDDLGNFKHFETNFFFRQFGATGGTSGASSPNWRKLRN